jgi:fatty acyl-CoA reductase
VQLFDRLKVVQPNFIRKITLVIGDCEKPDLGLSEEDKALLVARVDVVIHCAATVNFIEPLRRTTFINVRSTRDLLLLARRMNGLKVNEFDVVIGGNDNIFNMSKASLSRRFDDRKVNIISCPYNQGLKLK